jgi:hypothetical protein
MGVRKMGETRPDWGTLKKFVKLNMEAVIEKP